MEKKPYFKANALMVDTLRTSRFTAGHLINESMSISILFENKQCKVYLFYLTANSLIKDEKILLEKNYESSD